MWEIDLPLRFARQAARILPMTRIEYIPTRNADGTVSLRAVVVGPLERLRRFLRAL